MKILIAYDGSVCSDNAIIDLRRAGLSAVAGVLVLSVAETSPHLLAATALAAGSGMVPPDGFQPEATSFHELGEARAMALQGKQRLQSDFPHWKIDTVAWVDSAGSAIIRQARVWEPDLIVVGSHGRSGIGRLVLGSVSLKVLHQAAYSVRISRHHLHSQEQPIRLLIAVDGSENSKAAAQTVAARTWPPGTEARAVGVLDSRIALAAATTLEGTIPVVFEDEARKCLAQAVRDAAHVLKESGLAATHQVIGGIPSEVLLTEAETWSADCIFVGAKKCGGLERFLLGSVSENVASHAHCSVEVVRPAMTHSVRCSEASRSTAAACQ